MYILTVCCFFWFLFRDDIEKAKLTGDWRTIYEFYSATFDSFQEVNVAFKVRSKYPLIHLLHNPAHLSSEVPLCSMGLKLRKVTTGVHPYSLVLSCPEHQDCCSVEMAAIVSCVQPGSQCDFCSLPQIIEVWNGVT